MSTSAIQHIIAMPTDVAASGQTFFQGFALALIPDYLAIMEDWSEIDRPATRSIASSPASIRSGDAPSADDQGRAKRAMFPNRNSSSSSMTSTRPDGSDLSRRIGNSADKLSIV